MNHRDRKNRSDQSFNWSLPTALIIEMDSVVDSKTALFSAYCQLLSKYGLEGTKVEFHELAGLLPKELALHLSDKYGLKNTLEGLEKEYLALLAKQYQDGVVLAEGTLKCLQYAQQLGLTMAVVSMLGQKVTREILEAKNLFKMFDMVVTAAEVPVNESGSSNLYQHALAKLGTAEEEAMAVVYSSHAVEALREVSIYTLWLKNGAHDVIPQHFFASDRRCAHVKNWDHILRCLHHWYQPT